MHKGHNSNIKSSGCFQSCVVSLLRHPLHWAADQPCWCDWGHTHGFVVWVWCCQLSIHIHVLFPQVSCTVGSVQFCLYSSLFIACCLMAAPSDVKLCALWLCTGMSQTVTFLHWRDGSSRLWTWLSARRNGTFMKRIHFGRKVNICLITFGLCAKDCNDTEADVPTWRRPKQTDGLLGHDQECYFHTNRQREYPVCWLPHYLLHYL